MPGRKSPKGDAVYLPGQIAAQWAWCAIRCTAGLRTQPKIAGCAAKMATQQGAGSTESLGDLLEVLVERIAVTAIGHRMQ